MGLLPTVEASANCTTSGAVPETGVAVKSAVGGIVVGAGQPDKPETSDKRNKKTTGRRIGVFMDTAFHVWAEVFPCAFVEWNVPRIHNESVNLFQRGNKPAVSSPRL
jgi:hypothetical protein